MKMPNAEEKIEKNLLSGERAGYGKRRTWIAKHKRVIWLDRDHSEWFAILTRRNKSLESCVASSGEMIVEEGSIWQDGDAVRLSTR